jgi:hypothetical protein
VQKATYTHPLNPAGADQPGSPVPPHPTAFRAGAPARPLGATRRPGASLRAPVPTPSARPPLGALGNEQSLQQFVNQSTWDPVPVQRRICERKLPLINPTAGTIDDVSVPKTDRYRSLWLRITAERWPSGRTAGSRSASRRDRLCVKSVAGIPAITDRVVQAALELVLESISEAEFKPVSSGFRPLRRAHDAIAEVHFYGTHSYGWVLDADIEACFDSIDHTALMHGVRLRVKYKSVLRLGIAGSRRMSADG